MEQQLKGLTLDLQKMERDDILALRHSYEQDIAESIRGINHIHVELNRRVGQKVTEVLPEFGKPIVSNEPLTLFDHDTFNDWPEGA